MLAVGDKRGTAEAIPRAEAYLRSDLVPDEPDDSREGEKPEVRQRPRVKKPNRSPTGVVAPLAIVVQSAA
jgi:hypothetical protein